MAYAIDVLPRALDDIRGTVRRIFGQTVNVHHAAQDRLAPDDVGSS